MDDGILGIGIDILEIARIQTLVEQSGRRFLEKHFSAGEINDCINRVDKYERLTGKFTAKEAVYKALSICREDHFSWKEIQILSNNNGAPRIELSGEMAARAKRLGSNKILLSISHCKEYATAVVIIVEDKHGSN